MSSLIVEVCEIEQVLPHENADRLEIAVVKGWNVIIQKEQYKPGDIAVYVPPDSVLPQSLIEKHGLEYLKGDRVKTIKLRGAVSQGLLLPAPANSKVGDDVANLLGIKKYEPPAPKYQANNGKQGSLKNPNPFFDKYTDIENIKHYNTVFKEGDMVVITEKLHGTSWRAGKVTRIVRGLKDKVKAFFQKMFGTYDTHEFVYGSRNVQLTYTNHKSWYGEDIYGQIAKKYDMANIIPKGYSIYGEVVGEGIQDLTYGRKELELFVYDVKFEGKYLPHDQMVAFCHSRGLQTVPVLYVGPYSEEILKELTDGESTICPGQIREGVVVKDRYEKQDTRVGRRILKSISVDYLTRKGGTEYH